MPTNRPTIVVASTFPAEQLKNSIEFWASEFRISVAVEFTPYNQVHQQLINPNSMLLNNFTGANVVIISIIDWIIQVVRDDGASDCQEDMHDGDQHCFYKDIIINKTKEFIALLKKSAMESSVPTVLIICPSRSFERDAKMTRYILIAENMILEESVGITNLFLTDNKDFIHCHPFNDLWMAYSEDVSEFSYATVTDLFAVELGTKLFRTIYALWTNPRKVIVVDADGTLWKGVCGEDGAMGVEIDLTSKQVQDFLVKQSESGMIICLCSKNNEDDLFQVFEFRKDEMPLKREMISSWRVNWNNKPENIKSIASELDLSLDSFIFIDDSPVECLEMISQCPDVLTFQLPCEDNCIASFLTNNWAFDHLRVTDEDRSRSIFYQQNLKRSEAMQQSAGCGSFVDRIGLKVQIMRMDMQDIPRVAQITQRTNQFNTTTIRRSESDMQAIMFGGGVECLVVKAQDRFGDYGLVGALMFSVFGQTLNVEAVVLSCRALARGIEYQMLARLAEIAKEKKLSYVDVMFIPTRRNKPALDFLNRVDAKYRCPWDNGFRFSFHVDSLMILDPSTGHDDYAHAERAPATQTGGALLPIQTTGSTESLMLTRIATDLSEPEAVLRAMRARMKARPADLEVEYVAPRTPVEIKLVAAWSELLGIEGLGVHDDFFDLGGHSLLAFQLIAQVRLTFHAEIASTVLFTGVPTVAGLALAIEQSQIEDAGSDEIAKALRELEALSDQDVHRLLMSIAPELRSYYDDSHVQHDNLTEM